MERAGLIRTVKETARAFVTEAFAALHDEHVLPTPEFNPYLEVGRDYYGDSIRGPAYEAFEAALETAFAERFAEPHKRQHAEFASTYIFRFLEACVARCGRANGVFDATTSAVDESINELIAVLEEQNYTATCCRVVAHLTTADGSYLQIGELQVVPEEDKRHDLTRKIASKIPGAVSAFNRHWPTPYDPPHCMIVACSTSSDADVYGVCRRLSGQIERLLLLVRLLTAGTVQSYYEVSGLSTLVSRMTPLYGTFRKGMLDSLVRRTVRLSQADALALSALGDLLDAVDVKREGMVATSFDVALGKFNGSHVPESAFEHLVDLATALEAIMSGGESDNEALTLRLKTRAAALLSSSRDSAKAIFEDVGVLYGLRSKLVHGGQIKEAELRRIVSRVSTVPAEAPFGVALAHAVDRIRDLVRRSILVRICLACDSDPPWPFSDTPPVDSLLVEPETRRLWQERARERMAAIGATSALDRPRLAADFLSPNDR
jgi:hypothetical protein